MPRKHLSLENIDILDETEFEEFCFEAQKVHVELSGGGPRPADLSNSSTLGHHNIFCT